MTAKTKFKKVLSMACAAAMLSGVLAGCGGSGTGTQGSAPASGDTPKETTAEAPAAEGDQVLKFAVWDYGTTDYWAKIIEAFEAANPGVKVQPIDIPSADYTAKTPIMLASGDDTDIFTVKDMPTYSGMIAKNQIISLDDYVAKDGIDMAPYAGVDESIRVDGKLYALPFRSDYWLLYYNKDMFDEAGIAYPTGELTWDAYRDLAKKLTKGEGGSKVYGAFAHTWLSAVLSWAYTDGAHSLIDGEYEFLKPAYELALGMQNEDKSIMEFGSLKTANIHYSGPFYKKQVAMIPMGTWFINSIINTKNKGETDVNWGFTQVPHMEGQAVGETIGNVTPLAINKNSKNAELAWEFIKFVGTEPGAKVLADLGTLPAYKTPEILSAFSSIEGFPEECKGALDVKKVTLEMPPHPELAAVEKILKEEHELIMLGATSIDEGIANMDKRVQELLKK
ncbi:MAG: sugar transporter substrate-binding protein [Clostridia bacterium]|nr:sugar transporter substrate-binding protein [Clostridia bacterium]